MLSVDFPKTTHCLYVTELIPCRKSDEIVSCKMSTVVGMAGHTAPQIFGSSSTSMTSAQRKRHQEGQGQDQQSPRNLVSDFSGIDSFLCTLVTNPTRRCSLAPPWSKSADSCQTQERQFSPSIVAKTRP